MDRTKQLILEIGQILETVEHETRMVRLDPSHPDNRPYQILNKLGKAIQIIF